MPIAAPKWRLWTKLYWMRLCSMRRQQAGRLKFAIRSRKGGTWRGFAPEQVLPPGPLGMLVASIPKTTVEYVQI
jgi:hypothetical protein